ncbi:MAG TPA: sugar phosphate isomerase/epimerase family protein [Blastocatellia bacterium]|jgi:sugar phosphate isomerase/epimerase|nr:sugar phosphate isomerase/epimerase family protein [Blastocatellia bacterium]
MDISRRRFIAAGAVGFASAAVAPYRDLVGYGAAKGVKFKVGVTDWNLKQEAKTTSIELARRLGFEGIQISLGVGTEKLPLADPATQKAFLDESRRVGLPLASVCLNILHRNILKSDPLGQRWVADSIPIAKALGVKVILLPFFGRGALKTQAEMDFVGDALREIAPSAEKAKIILGLEDTISAKDNVRIMERAKSKAVLTYYDVGNSTQNGFNVIEEIRWLGRDRICEVHIKDNPGFLGAGKIDFTAVVDALADIGFSQWAQLETDSPTKSVENDMTTNLNFIRGIIAKRNAAR